MELDFGTLHTFGTYKGKDGRMLRVRKSSSKEYEDLRRHRNAHTVATAQNLTYLLSDSWEDDEERYEQSEEYEVHGDGLDVPGDRGSVAVTVQCGSAIATECVEPTRHLTDSSPLCNKETSTIIVSHVPTSNCCY